MEHMITEKKIGEFEQYLRREERAENTIVKYLHDIRAFNLWLGQAMVTKESVLAWKEYLLGSGCAAVTVNSSLAALHSFFAFMGWEGYRVKYLKIQRRVFREKSRELTRGEFVRLVDAARAGGNTRLLLILETICATGIRVSEIKYITVAAIRKGRADISLKGKVRTILFPGKLVRKLEKYARKEKIACGEIFLTASGYRISRQQIWSEMKQLCQRAGVEKSKVYPHNLRHLFARTFYQICRDIVKLADVLGHSSIETTRIYLIATGEEHTRQLDKLGLIQ